VFATLEAPTRAHFDSRGVIQRDTLNSVFLAQVLDAFRRGFVLPGNIGLKVYHISENANPPLSTLAVFGEVAFSLTADGSIARARVSQSSLSPTLDKSMVDALHRGDSLHAFPPSWAAGNQEPPWFFVAITTDYRPATPAVPLFKLRVPVWHEQTTPSLDPNHPSAVPHYPSDLAQTGFEGNIVLEFVIDDSGRPVLSTFRLMSGGKIDAPPATINLDAQPDAQLNEFVDAITKSLAGGHYIPGTVAGCAVNALVEQPYAFKIRRIGP
jgi:hypothetical protein